MPPKKQKRPHPSGAAGRRKKYEKEEAAAKKIEPPDDGKWADDFQAAGAPDMENPDTDLAYVRKLQLIVLRQMATTPDPSLAQQSCWRRIREMSAVVGMTSNRASLEARCKKLEALLKDRQQQGAVRIEAGDPSKKSPNARGMRRGPRPLPDEPTDPEPAEPATE